MAIHYMQLHKPRKWKTLDKLIALREAIRQSEANYCGFVDEVLDSRKITLERYKHFMQLARAQDFQHHGCHTF